MKIDLLLVGFGNVARRFVQLLDESRASLDALAITPVVVGIVTRRHGACHDSAGVDAVRAARLVEAGAVLGPEVPDAFDAIRQLGASHADARVLIETTPLDVQSGEPAIGHVRAAIASGVHVVTANKGPAAIAYGDLDDLARRAGVSFLFEGAVMDGIPIFNFVRETMPGVEIRGFRGVLNSTTNHMLSAMERGEPFAAALARMQADGVAEADPSLDIDGWDAAAKTSALANVLLEAELTPQRVLREGISESSADRARSVLAAGRRLKLVASAAGRGGGIVARVRLEELDARDPLAILDDQANALELDTWPLGRIVITERDGGLEKTAYALIADLVTVARRVRARA